MDKIILVDVDGVCIEWTWSFGVWMFEHGFEIAPDGKRSYALHGRYGIRDSQVDKLVKMFNESASIGYLPAFRDAYQYIRALHYNHGYKFHAITALGTHENAQKLRELNLKKTFGDSTFEKILFVDNNSSKIPILKEYEGTGYIWVEDKSQNAEDGLTFGLKSIIMDHPYNKDCNKEIMRVNNWKEIYDHIIGENGN